MEGNPRKPGKCVYFQLILIQKSTFSEPRESPGKFIPKWKESQEMFSSNSSTEIAVFRTPRIHQEIHHQMGGKLRKAGKWFWFQLNVVQKSPFSEPLESPRKFIPKWKGRKRLRFQLTVEQKSPFSALLELTRKFIPESTIALPC